MIVYDLRCANDHVFEAWFASSRAFDEQQAAGHVRCPICDDADVGKAAMAPRVGAKGNQAPAADPRVALRALAAAQAKMLQSSEWVGSDFANRARAMHLGEEKQASIHGQATLADAKALLEDGVAVAPLPLPVVPPKALN